MPISRRIFILGSGAAAVFPSAVFADNRLPQFVAWHDRDAQNHTAERDKFGAQGYRTTSLSIYGDSRQPLHAAVMVKRQTVHSELQDIGLTLADLRAWAGEMAGQNMYPYIVTGIGRGRDTRFGASFRPMNTPSEMKFLNGKQLIAENKKAFDESRRLIWVDSYGSANSFRYCAIWSGNKSVDGWNHRTSRKKFDQLREIYLAMKKSGAHPELITVTPDGRFLTYYSDEQLGDVSLRGGISSARYQQEADRHLQAGYFPYRVNAKKVGSKTTFAAIFAKREDSEPRTFRSTGPVTIAAIDQVFEYFMKDQVLRGASLAIADEKRLVYAKGYTFAEPSYPDIKPETYFRVASVSKHITALALFRFMELLSSDGGSLDLNTRIQSFLGLKQPNGTAPADQRFDDITIAHLLDASAGLEKKFYHRLSVQAAKAFNESLPATPTQIARYLTQDQLKHTPGDLSGVTYGRTAYFMLALLLTRLMNKASFEEALKVLIMQPTGITRLRNSRTLVEDQLPNEARYHIRDLRLGKSKRSDERPLLPLQYGNLDYEAVGGPGGLSIAMPDLARLGAVLSDPEGGVFLSKNNRSNFLRRAIAQKKAITAAGGVSGVSGFDRGMQELSANPAHFQYSKGGALDGVRASIRVRTNGYTLAFAYNGDPRKGATAEWRQPLEKLLNAGNITWPTVDLFPNYGMSSL